jgi:plastocyanin
MFKAIAIVIAVVAIVSIAVIYVNSTKIINQEAPKETTGNVISPASTDQAPPAPAETIKTFTVTGQNFSFSPASLTVNQGDTVRIIFKSASGFHDFGIDEFKVATKQIQGGQEETVEFIADKTGVFEYYCSVGNHRAMGMKGALTVQ